MLRYQTTIKLHETDAAGVLFYSNQFKLIHDAYEELLNSIRFGFAELVKHQHFFLPIVHTESDYKSPLSVGDRIEIQVKVAHVGTTSFTLTYDLLNDTHKLVGSAKTVHVSIDKTTHQKINLPADFRLKMESLLD